MRFTPGIHRGRAAAVRIGQPIAREISGNPRQP